MGHLASWKVLENAVADFRKKGIAVPAEIISNLKTAKTMIKILKTDTSYEETAQKIEEYLSNLESYLMSEAQEKIGTEYMEKLLKRLYEAKAQTFEEEEDETRFVPNFPRDQKWIRVKPTAEMSIEKIKALVKESNLSCDSQSDGYLLVYGEDKNVKDFVKKMATKHKPNARK